MKEPKEKPFKRVPDQLAWHLVEQLRYEFDNFPNLRDLSFHERNREWRKRWEAGLEQIRKHITLLDEIESNEQTRRDTGK